MRILNVADFNWMTGAERDTVNLSLFDICRKLGFAATRAGHMVVEFSDRAVARRGLGGRATANRRFLQTVDELKPDLILLHFADIIRNESLVEVRKLSPGVKIADINIDPIDTEKNQRRLGMRTGFVDALFVTTAEPSLGRYAGPGSFAAFMPNPVDRSVETGRAFENATPEYDLLFPATDAGPREIGAERLSPIEAVARLKSALPDIRLLTPGIESPRLRGAAYLAALSSARIGWSLSRRSSLPLYASDRMAHMFGSGLAVALDRGTGFDRFYGVNEAVFYDDLEDLAAKLRPLLADAGSAREVGKAGWDRTWRTFEAGRVFDYLLAQLFNDVGTGSWEWPTRRWSTLGVNRS
jgi:hypothetical protein